MITCACRAINVPDKLLDALSQQQQTTGKEAMLIHISTDQVREASHQHSSEASLCTSFLSSIDDTRQEACVL
jgi:hypothetical protein